ncbi:MAG: hypothetical protein JW920_03760 [Deltaproteobacteria bacterium]|nr:hypothetical protein [Deltaproteobacteria bacterium]
MKLKRILLIAILVNLGIMITCLQINPGIVAADDGVETTQNEVIENPLDRWELITEKEQELRMREMELNELEKQLQIKIAELKNLEQSIKIEVENYRTLSDERIRHLVKIYSSMNPKAAASLMDNMDLDVAVSVFLHMKGEIAGGIISYMDTQKAATITKNLATYRNNQPSTPSATTM